MINILKILINKVKIIIGVFRYDVFDEERNLRDCIVIYWL